MPAHTLQKVCALAFLLAKTAAKRAPHSTLIARTISLLFASLLLPLAAHAAGTPAGTTISNSANLVYTLGSSPPASTTSIPVTFVVDNKINLTVTKVADAPAIVRGSTKQTLAFTVTNNGNATQRYALAAVAGPATITSMTNIRIYRDVNGDNAWDAGDTAYVDASTFGDVAPDASLKILIVADTPAVAANTQTATFYLVATTVDAGTTTVTAATAGADTAGVDKVFSDIAGSAPGDAARDGKHSAPATYTVANSSLATSMTKAIIDMQDATGCDANVCSIVSGTTADYQCTTSSGTTCKIGSGSTVTYRVDFNVNGGGSVTGLVLSDPVPANMTYVPGSIVVNGAAKTDAADGDLADFGITTPNSITVTPGTVTAPAAVWFTFRAIIN